MYHLLKGLHEYLTRKDEYSILILGLAGAGKTTLLERIKTIYNQVPGLPPDKIAPTIGQNGTTRVLVGKITLSSSVLQFWDLGGQTGIRNIWNRYYSQCHAVAYVVDAQNREHLNEGWEVFHSVLSEPEILDVPLLLLANKQDSPESLSAEEIRESYETWWQAKLKSSSPDDISQSQDRVASLQVIGISALNGQGIREAIEWLFLRVQNTRRERE